MTKFAEFGDEVLCVTAWGWSAYCAIISSAATFRLDSALSAYLPQRVTDQPNGRDRPPRLVGDRIGTA